MPDDPNKGATNPDIEKLTKTVSGLVTLTQTLARQNQEQGTRLNALLEKVEKGELGGGKPQQKTEDKDGPLDISTEDGNLDVNKLGGYLKNIVADAVKPLSQELEGMKKTSASSRIQQEFTELREKHKDFEEWAPEIKELAKENPGLNLKRLYTLARAENPDKAKELDEKFAEPNPDDLKKQEQAKIFGGLFPSSTAKNSGSGEDDKGGESKMTFSNASDKAWDEVMGELPTQLFGTEEG